MRCCDVPGTGKALLATPIAKSIDGRDLQAHSIHADPLPADEMNQAAPRTQFSLQECMEERQPPHTQWYEVRQVYDKGSPGGSYK